MSEAEIAVSVLLMLSGLGLLFSLARHRSLPGVAFGAIVSTMGGLLLADLSGLVSYSVEIILVFILLFAAFGDLYFLTGRKRRTLLMLAIPAIMLALFLL